MRRALLVGIVVYGLAACAPAGAGSGPGVGVGYGSARDDRVLISAFNDVSAVAAGGRYVHAATANGLTLLDRQFERWLPPLTWESGRGEASAIAADPLDDGVWVAVPGRTFYYQPNVELLTPIVVPGLVDVIMFDARDPAGGAYLRASGQWYLASRIGTATPVAPGALPPADARVLAPTLAALYREFPSLQSFGALLTRDARLRSWPVTSGAKAPGRTEVWLGTRGGGLFRADPMFNRSEQFPFGLLAEGASALAHGGDGTEGEGEGEVWIASWGARFGGRGGLSLGTPDLQRWRWIEGPLGRPLFAARAADLARLGSVAWVATGQGVTRVDTEREDGVQSWSLTNGLPDDRALSVWPTSGGAWVGTARGLAFISVPPSDHDGRRGRGEVARSLLRGTAVRALLVVRDTLWVGSDAGLLALPLSVPDATPQRAPAVRAEPRLTRPVAALALSGSSLLVALDDALLSLGGDSAAVPRLGAANVAAAGRVNAVGAAGNTILIGGSNGVLVVDRASGASRLLPVPREIPAEALDVLVGRDYAWVATPLGVLRLRLLPPPGGGVR